MENGIQYLKTERYTPEQIVNPSLNLNFEPINPVETISGYQRLYRPESSSQQSSENSEASISQEKTTKSRNSSQKNKGRSIQETVQVETVYTPTVQQTTPVETKLENISTKKGKRYSNKQDFVKDMTEAYTKVLASRGISTDYAKMLVAQDALESN